MISGIVHVLKTGCRWRDVAAEYGPHTTTYNRFNRWPRRRLWTHILEALVEVGALAQSTAMDSSYAKAQRSAHGGKGAKAQAIGPSRGGQTTNIHTLTDLLGRPIVLHLTPGNVSDSRAAGDLLASAAGPIKRLIADKGYDGGRLRGRLRRQGTRPIIPARCNRKPRIRHDTRRYQERWRIESAFCRLKDFRPIATRYDKLAANFLSAVALATIIAFWA